MHDGETLTPTPAQVVAILPRQPTAAQLQAFVDVLNGQRGRPAAGTPPREGM